MRDKKELTREILYLLAGGGLFLSAFFAPGMSRLLPLVLRQMNKTRTKQKLSRLEKRKVIKFILKGNETFIEITEKGKRELLKFDFKELEIKKPKKWDRFWRLVIFDIPESKKKARDALRQKLNQLGFYQIQKSVFIFPFDCSREIDFLKGFFEIDRFVRQIVVKSIENDDEIKNLFKNAIA